MSAELVTQDGISEVSSLLIPLHEKQLILPNVTVAEIIPYRSPTVMSGHANWLLGQLEWRNIDIPVISYELLSGAAMPPIEGARLAVVNGTGNNSALPFFAILIQGIPKLTHVKEDDIVTVEAMHSGPYDQMAVSLFDEQAMIPDLDMIENELLRHIG
ncbi:MAG: chemotaxis protein CheW [Oleispira antarctica]|nr:chemotaxis protein CheW [Oleispira antarctica]MBQ0791751.1 chemotaxis protein CheW [Oleispira antarctica]